MWMTFRNFAARIQSKSHYEETIGCHDDGNNVTSTSTAGRHMGHSSRIYRTGRHAQNVTG